MHQLMYRSWLMYPEKPECISCWFGSQLWPASDFDGDPDSSHLNFRRSCHVLTLWWPVNFLTMGDAFFSNKFQVNHHIWTLKSPTYKLMCGNVGMVVGVSREGGSLQTLMVAYPAMSTHNHSISDYFGDWSTSDHSNRLWTKVAKPCFLLRTDPAGERLGITVSPSVISWSMLGRGSSSAAACLPPRLAPGVSLHSPRWTHSAPVAVVALVVTGLVDISSNVAQGGPHEGTCHPLLSW